MKNISWLPWHNFTEKTGNKEYDRTPVKYLNVLHHNRTQTQLQHFSLNITNLLFWVLSLASSIKNNNANLQKLWCLSASKQWTASLTFLRNCKDIANLLIWVLWECLIKPINNASITLKENLVPKVLKSGGKKLWCLSACKKSASSRTLF